MKLKPIISRFNFGEISPLLYGRVDFSKYHSGAKRMENFIPLVQGPVRRREGSVFVSETKSSSKVALLKFEFSANVTYIIEAGDYYMRFYHNYKHVKNDERIFEIITPYSEEDLFHEDGTLALNYVQSGDVLYIVCPTQLPHKLARYAHNDWSISKLNGWVTTRKNPSAITLFRERLCLASGYTIYMSASGAFEDFSDQGADPRADDPVEITIYSDQMNKIEWLCAAGGLLVGTAGGEFIVSETTSLDPFGPNNVKVTPQTNYGSSSIQSLRVGNAVLFVQRAGRKLRELVYDYSGDSYTAQDISIAAEHITKSGITGMAWQCEPLETLWLVRNDGTLVGFTYNREQEMTAWHKHVLGGNAKVEFATSLIAGSNSSDELWLSVFREVNGKKRRYIEVLKNSYLSDEEDESHFLDSAVKYLGQPCQKIEGLKHLEGFKIAVVADGSLLENKVIENGVLNLETPASEIVVGLLYKSILETLNLELNLSDGTSQGRTKRIVGVVLRLYKSLAGAVGPSLDNLKYLEYRKAKDKMNQPLPLFTGDTEEIKWFGGYERDGSIVVSQEEPFPFTIVSILPSILITG